MFQNVAARLFGRKAITDTGNLARFIEGLGIKSAAGKAVNPLSALGCVDVLGCVRVISEGIAQPPMRLLSKTADGRTSKVETEHPVHQILHVRPNDWQTPFEFKEQLLIHACLAGNAYAFITRGVDNKPIELLPLMPTWVAAKQLDNWALQYTITWPSGGQSTVPQDRILHFRGPVFDNVQGLPTVQLVREAVGLSLAIEEHQGKVHSNGVRVSGVLSTEQTLSETAAKRIRDDWEKNYMGSANAFRIALLEAGLKWQQLALSATDAQTIETLREQGLRIARGFRVFPALLGYTDKAATYASVEQFLIAHVVHTLAPWATRLEQRINLSLLSREEMEAGLYAKVFLQALMRGDAKTRASFYHSAILDGWMNRNEVRIMEDMDAGPVELDTFLEPRNMAPAGEQDEDTLPGDAGGDTSEGEGDDTGNG